MVTVIVPVYNAAKYIEACVKSVIGQSYTDWQLILVDDGSTDQSPTLCDALAATDQRISVLHQPNGGVSSARNTGLKAAQGEWITFIDADDEVADTYIYDLVNSAVSTGSDLVISGWVQGKANRQFADSLVDKSDYLRLYQCGAFMNVCAKLYRNDIIRSNHITFDTGVAWSEDTLFFNRYIQHCGSVSLISATNYHYIIRSSSASQRLQDYRTEIHGFEAAHSQMPGLIAMCGPQVRHCFSPYLFLLRAFNALKAADLDRDQKLQVLRSLKFDKRNLYFGASNWRERVFYFLILNKQWRLLAACM